MSATNLTYSEAIIYIVNNGYTHKAIMDLSRCANALMTNMQKETAELKAEKRTIKKFLESDWVAREKVDAINALLTEEDNG